MVEFQSIILDPDKSPNAYAHPVSGHLVESESHISCRYWDLNYNEQHPAMK